MVVADAGTPHSIPLSGAEITSETIISSDGSSDEKQDEPVSKGVQLIMGTICLLTLMIALDGTTIGTALPTMADDLSGTTLEAAWSGTSFLLTSAVFQPSLAALSGILGRRSLFLFSILLFFVGALVACLAKNFTDILVGRSIQGIGGGGIMAITELLITDLIPLRGRGTYYGMMNAVWTLGSVLGPVVGGAFAQKATWRWIFYINFPFIGIGVICVLLFLRLNQVKGSLKEQLLSFDWAGTVIFIGGTTAFLFALTAGGSLYAWASWRTLVPLIIGAIACVVFVLYEARLARVPSIPLILFQNRTNLVSYLGTVVTGLVLWCILYYMPLYFQAVKEYGAILSGVCMFPVTFTVAPAGIVSGILVTKTGKYRPGIWAGWAVSTLGLGLLCILKEDTSIPGWIFLMIVSGIGLGLLFPGLASAVQASVPHNVMAMSIAMFCFFRALGETLGVAIGGVVFENRMYANLLANPIMAAKAKAYSSDATGLVEVIKAMADGAEKTALKQAYVDSLRIVWAVCCALSGVVLLLSLLTKSYSLDQVLVSDQGFREKKNDDEEETGSQ